MFVYLFALSLINLVASFVELIVEATRHDLLSKNTLSLVAIRLSILPLSNQHELSLYGVHNTFTQLDGLPVPVIPVTLQYRLFLASVHSKRAIPLHSRKPSFF